jgi:hypothetical protein
MSGFCTASRTFTVAVSSGLHLHEGCIGPKFESVTCCAAARTTLRLALGIWLTESSSSRSGDQLGSGAEFQEDQLLNGTSPSNFSKHHVAHTKFVAWPLSLHVPPEAGKDMTSYTTMDLFV